jgi:hypothetical protein
MLLCPATLGGQVLKDRATMDMIKAGIDNIYKLEFSRAEEVHAKLEAAFPGHPVNLLFNGMMKYWKNYPLIPGSEGRASFEADLRNCIQLCEREEYPPEYEPEITLANICARGLLLLFYADNDLSMSVIPLAVGTYRYVMRSFELASTYADFYYFTGLYNYYREAYPRIYPIYRALVSPFPRGNEVKGLTELSKAAESAIFLSAESYFVLSWIYNGYQNDFFKSSIYSKILSDRYPENLLFRALNIRNLLLLKIYDEAEAFIQKWGNNNPNHFYNGQLLVFKGILQEKKYKNYPLATQYYNEAITALAPIGSYADEYTAYAYFGLSRISSKTGDRTGQRVYRKKANDLADFRNVNFD